MPTAALDTKAFRASSVQDRSRDFAKSCRMRVISLHVLFVQGVFQTVVECVSSLHFMVSVGCCPNRCRMRVISAFDGFSRVLSKPL